MRLFFLVKGNGKVFQIREQVLINLCVFEMRLPFLDFAISEFALRKLKKCFAGLAFQFGIIQIGQVICLVDQDFAGLVFRKPVICKLELRLELKIQQVI